MVSLTPLAKHLVAALVVSTVMLYSSMVGGIGFLLLCVFFWASIAGAVMLTPPARDNLTTMDRFMINLKRILQGNLPMGHIAGVMFFEKDELPTAPQATEMMKLMVPNYPRFASIAVQKPQVEDSYFQRVGQIDFASHIVEHPAVESDAELKVYINKITNTSLDATKPLWRFDILPNASGQGAVVLRINHCLGDGLRIVKAAGAFMKFEDGSPAELGLLKKMSNKKAAQGAKRGMVELVQQFIKDLPLVLTMDKLPLETPSCFHEPGTIGDPSKPVSCVSASVKFSDIKVILKASPEGTTINDVILAGFCGALRRYAKEVGGKDLAADTLMRSFIAVSLPDHPGRPAEDMYNDFMMPSFNLPVGASTTTARLDAIKTIMAGVKVSLTGPITTGFSHLLGRLGLDKLAGDTQLKVFPRHSFVYSNVPGFEQPVYLFGGKSQVRRFEAYYPNMITQTLFLTYCDNLSFSVTTNLLTSPETLTRNFVEEIAAWVAEVAK